MKRIPNFSVALPMMFLAFALSALGQSKKGLNCVVAFAQKDSPVEMQSVTHSSQFLYQLALVKNVSNQTICSITFGILANNSNTSGNKPILVSSRQIATNIDRGLTRSVDIEDARPADVQAKVSGVKANPVDLEFGIIEVQFANGSSWHYDWQNAGGFEPRSGSR